MEKQPHSTEQEISRTGTVTRISFQKKKTDRRSIFIDDQYAFSMSERTFRAFPLEINQKLSEDQIESILNREELEKTKDLALRYIAIRMRSEFELRQYLRRKECTAANINTVIQYCYDRDYLNDREYAGMLIRDMININRYGRNKMFARLRKRGISSEIINAALQDELEDSEQLKNAEELAAKKIKTIREQSKMREKLYRYLHQRGFSYEIIAKVLNRFVDQSN